MGNPVRLPDKQEDASTCLVTSPLVVWFVNDDVGIRQAALENVKCQLQSVPDAKTRSYDAAALSRRNTSRHRIVADLQRERPHILWIRQHESKSEKPTTAHRKYLEFVTTLAEIQRFHGGRVLLEASSHNMARGFGRSSAFWRDYMNTSDMKYCNLGIFEVADHKPVSTHVPVLSSSVLPSEFRCRCGTPIHGTQGSFGLSFG